MMQPLALITKASHHFAINNPSPAMREVCVAFSKRLISYRLAPVRGQLIREPDKVYAAADASRVYFRFHINQFNEFMTFMNEKGIYEKNVEISNAENYEPFKCDLPIKKGWSPRPDQIDHIEYLATSPHASRLLTRGTGTGKTACTLFACSKIGQRMVIVVKPMYMKKWHSDVCNILDITGDDIMMVAGAGQLKLVLEMALKNELTDKVIIISITTLQRWISDVEDNGPQTLADGYACYPWHLFQVLKAGVRIIDEVHQFFHQMFKLDLYSHVPASISLSATLIHKEPIMLKMYHVMFPVDKRTKDIPLKRYIDTVAVHFDFYKPEMIRTTERGNKSYSHNAVEKSIMNHTATMINYMRLIKSMFDVGYIGHPRKKKKVAIFASTIEMCGKIKSYLSHHYPNLDIRRYCDGDPYENAIEADVRVTTIGSCGTAIDIPDLVSVINTHNVSSVQANIQALGRLRELNGTPEESAVTYYFPVADNIQKYITYYNERRTLFKERAKTFKDVQSGLHV